MSASELFPNENPDMESRFWTTYERVAKQSDEELLERHNSNLDVLLIFVSFSCPFLHDPQAHDI